MGYDTLLGDNGVRLSGGQRPRVANVRALLKNADLLILDEATSDLDSHLERRVQRAIENTTRYYAIIGTRTDYERSRIRAASIPSTRVESSREEHTTSSSIEVENTPKCIRCNPRIDKPHFAQ